MGEMCTILILTIGESGRCTVEFSATPATFCDTEIKMKGRRVASCNPGTPTADEASADDTYFLVLSCFPHLLTRYLRLPANLLLNPAVKCAYSNVRGTIKMIESG